MPPKWESPLYKLKAATRKDVVIDVTTSVAPGLRAHKVLKESIIPWFRARGVRSVLDFGAGALRHTFPLLRAGFEVCAVEFKETFARPVCAAKKARAEKNANFSALIWPAEFLGDRRRFDAALVCF